MMILLLLSISDPIASSSPSDESLGAALKNESFELVLGTTIEPNSNSTEAVPYFVAEIKTIIGFASSIKSMYEEFDKLLNPAVTPKYTVDDVMSRINEQFSKVSQDLNEIKTTLNENQMAVYGNVELALNNAFNDMRLTNTIQLKSRAINLFDRLGEFMKGMLGKFNILPDLLKTVSGLYDVSYQYFMRVDLYFLYYLLIFPSIVIKVPYCRHAEEDERVHCHGARWYRRPCLLRQSHQ